ncbi:unnamed protein product, partial [Meganyctiphanes norvegica]
SSHFESSEFDPLRLPTLSDKQKDGKNAKTDEKDKAPTSSQCRNEELETSFEENISIMELKMMLKFYKSCIQTTKFKKGLEKIYISQDTESQFQNVFDNLFNRDKELLEKDEEIKELNERIHNMNEEHAKKINEIHNHYQKEIQNINYVQIEESQKQRNEMQKLNESF